MDIAQKALYNSLRITWLQEKISVEPWKVEDYRGLSLEELFSRLQKRDIFLDRVAFKNYADQFDTPEEFTEWLQDQEKENLTPEEYDQLYLVVFELWRRLIPEKPSISILCDELDYQIFNYDQGKEASIRHLADALSHFHTLLEENQDMGMDPEETLAALSEYLANDIEHFLYDFIADQIDAKDYDYAQELVEKFFPFVSDKKWFDLLKARLVNVQDLHQANELLETIFEANQEEPLLALNLDMLSLMVQGGNYELFLKVVFHTLSLIEYEEDFVELLKVASDFFRCLDEEQIEGQINALIHKRKERQKEALVSQDDPDLAAFKASVASLKKS